MKKKQKKNVITSARKAKYSLGDFKKIKFKGKDKNLSKKIDKILY